MEAKARPKLHFTPQKGWINDPNGLIFFKGEYHLFYQYNPYHNNWDSMHWGHAVSEDLLHWKELEVALCPDEPYDNHPEGGCFSGSVVVWEDTMYLFYTGTIKREGKTVQTQCLATSEDGRTFSKYKGNPLIERVPDGGGEDFRDPKVFYAQGKWRMVCGGTDGSADNPDSIGRIYLYTSRNLYQWEYSGILYEAQAGEGSMFECPDVFSLGDSWVITASPMYAADFRPNTYLAGKADFDRCRFCVERKGILDGGTHYYAVQSYPDREGKMISVAWLGGWLWMPWIHDFGPDERYRGVLSIPREVFLDEAGYLCSRTLDALEESSDMEKKVESLETDSSEELRVSDINQVFYLKLKIDFGREKEKTLEITLSDTENRQVTATLNPKEGVLIVDYSNADEFSRFGRREMECRVVDMKTEIEIILDKSVFSIFANHGRYCYTGKVYPSGSLSLNAALRPDER